jgi:hypothetical protein
MRDSNREGMRLEIDIGYLQEQLGQLLRIPSPTGYTDTIVRHVCGELDRLDVGYDVTRRGAVRAHLKGATAAGARAIVSHLDTLGAQVKALKPNGRLALVPIGTWSARFAEGARTTIFTEQGVYRGTILPLKASGHTYGEEVTASRSAGIMSSSGSMPTPRARATCASSGWTWATSWRSTRSPSSCRTASSSRATSTTRRVPR